eukprot:CAMPEP_0180518506 /NCGR_PEP_ID=MMETSP1036_2-20121128/55138_1 /TAXON_ID=632150 /ORGANISM="Azadinium spinosum, Strain 3D9" /LENGTH=48 /DNA_ID= /DNA_START= /DNA_END= /DNA_ORIENTATION=
MWGATAQLKKARNLAQMRHGTAYGKTVKSCRRQDATITNRLNGAIRRT